MIVDHDWIREQMTEAKVRVAPGTVVLELINTWEQHSLTEGFAQDAIEIFSKLALGIPLVDNSEPNEVWREGGSGIFHVGDTVRVKIGALKDPSVAWMHNGRRGRVVAIRHGDVIVAYTDGKEPELTNAHFSPFSLEKLIS